MENKGNHSNNSNKSLKYLLLHLKNKRELDRLLVKNLRRKILKLLVLPKEHNRKEERLKLHKRNLVRLQKNLKSLRSQFHHKCRFHLQSKNIVIYNSRSQYLDVNRNSKEMLKREEKQIRINRIRPIQQDLLMKTLMQKNS